MGRRFGIRNDQPPDQALLSPFFLADLTRVKSTRACHTARPRGGRSSGQRSTGPLPSPHHPPAGAILAPASQARPDFPVTALCPTALARQPSALRAKNRPAFPRKAVRGGPKQNPSIRPTSNYQDVASPPYSATASFGVGTGAPTPSNTLSGRRTAATNPPRVGA